MADRARHGELDTQIACEVAFFAREAVAAIVPIRASRLIVEWCEEEARHHRVVKGLFLGVRLDGDEPFGRVNRRGPSVADLPPGNAAENDIRSCRVHAKE